MSGLCIQEGLSSIDWPAFRRLAEFVFDPAAADNTFKENVLTAIHLSTAQHSIPIAVELAGVARAFLILHVGGDTPFGDRCAYFSNLICANAPVSIHALLVRSEQRATEYGARSLIGPVHNSVLVPRGIPTFRASTIHTLRYATYGS